MEEVRKSKLPPPSQKSKVSVAPVVQLSDGPSTVATIAVSVCLSAVLTDLHTEHTAHFTTSVWKAQTKLHLRVQFETENFDTRQCRKVKQQIHCLPKIFRFVRSQNQNLIKAVKFSSFPSSAINRLVHIECIIKNKKSISFSFSDFTLQLSGLVWEFPSTPRAQPAQTSLISMELEKLSNGNYHHDAAAAVEKGFVSASLLHVDPKPLGWIMKSIHAWWPPGQRLISCIDQSTSELLHFSGVSLDSHRAWMLLAWRRKIPSSSKLYFASWTFISCSWAPTWSKPAWYKYTTFCRHCKW